MYNYFLTREHRLMDYDFTDGKKRKIKSQATRMRKYPILEYILGWKQQITLDQISSCVSILRWCTCVVYNTAYVKKTQYVVIGV